MKINDSSKKYICLFLLVMQNLIITLSIRYSRKIVNDNKSELKPYLPSVISIFTESVKFIACFVILFFEIGKYYFDFKKKNRPINHNIPKGSRSKSYAHNFIPTYSIVLETF